MSNVPLPFKNKATKETEGDKEEKSDQPEEKPTDFQSEMDSEIKQIQDGNEQLELLKKE